MSQNKFKIKIQYSGREWGQGAQIMIFYLLGSKNY